MNFLVPVMMWGWIPFNIFLFKKYTPQIAILISVIGGVLFLPVTSFDIPMISYNKDTAIAISLLIGIIFSGNKTKLTFRPGKIDIPIIIWCIISPFLTFLINMLGPYNAVAAVIEESLTSGVYYLFGRIYFSDKDSLRLLSRGIITGGLIYVPLALFEVRMSPQLCQIVYGFFPHDWFQHIRYGGFRPIVFMNHGLMVAMWMAATYIVALWLYGTKEIAEIKKIPMRIVVILLFITTVLCKSANGWVYAIIGTIGFYCYKKFKSNIIFIIIILIIPIYITLRISGILPVETILDYLSKIFDAERIESLSVRLFQEDLFNKRAMERYLLGWGWITRAWPMDPFTGLAVINFIDSYFLIVFSNRGYLGLFSFYAFLLLGPWKIMKSRTNSIDAIVLNIIIIFFTIDTLLNGMINVIYFLTAGALIGFSDMLKNDELTKSEH